MRCGVPVGHVASAESRAHRERGLIPHAAVPDWLMVRVQCRHGSKRSFVMTEVGHSGHRGELAAAFGQRLAESPIRSTHPRKVWFSLGQYGL